MGWCRCKLLVPLGRAQRKPETCQREHHKDCGDRLISVGLAPVGITTGQLRQSNNNCLSLSVPARPDGSNDSSATPCRTTKLSRTDKRRDERQTLNEAKDLRTPKTRRLPVSA